MPSATTQPAAPLSHLPFPPLTTSHILACSYHSWHPLFRTHTPKARLIPLTQPFLDYLRADGIVLPSNPTAITSDADSGYDTSDSEDGHPDPALHWRPLHDLISTTITSLGGKVVPKLNWSAPKDAVWISSTNDMTCQSADDIYLLLKSSDFITHDLEHAFSGCVDATPLLTSTIPYHLVLRKNFEINPALEFRCFIRNRRLIGISQREMNHFDFLFDLRTRFKALIQTFLDEVILKRFDEESFVIDVYIPPPHERVWLIDVNPWAERTDPLLFSWLELLRMPEVEEVREEVVRLQLRPTAEGEQDNSDIEGREGGVGDDEKNESDGQSTDSSDEEEENLPSDPEFRLVQRDDPEAYQFAATKYSAHKLPREVVDASMTPSGMKDMMEEWKRVMAGEEGGGVGDDSD